MRVTRRGLLAVLPTLLVGDYGQRPIGRLVAWLGLGDTMVTVWFRVNHDVAGKLSYGAQPEYLEKVRQRSVEDLESIGATDIVERAVWDQKVHSIVTGLDHWETVHELVGFIR